jgi:hypothetical protein
VDLVSIVTGASVPADGQHAALVSELQRRHLHLPETFDVPDRQLWEAGYPVEARRSLLTTGRTLDEALPIVQRFINPLLNGTASGTWDHERREWK